MAKFSIIIRTKNEEKWIGHCLEMIYQQDLKDFEIVLVDNASKDNTVQIAKRFGVNHIIYVDQFKPGHALNEGIRVSNGEYLVCLSAHCIPKNKMWLRSLYQNFVENDLVAGVYGRQLPLSYTGDIDKRDLFIVFGQDKKVQIKDYFFHNANSMIRRSVWEIIPFDENVSNIEDRVWGKEIISRGYQIIYEPEAPVYHHHGLHQSNSPQRARGVVSIIERIDADTMSEIPECIKPDKICVSAVIPIGQDIEFEGTSFRLLKNTVKELKRSKFVDSIYLLASNTNLAKNLEVNHLSRALISNVDALGIDELLQKSLELIEGRGEFPHSLLYVNYDYLSRPAGIFDDLIMDAQYKGCDSVFAAYTDFGHFWIKDETGEYIETAKSLRSRNEREPIYRGLYGLGCVTTTSLIRAGKLVGGKVGILPLQEVRYTLRLRDLELSTNGNELFPILNIVEGLHVQI